MKWNYPWSYCYITFKNYTWHFHHLLSTLFGSPQQMCEVWVASTILTVSGVKKLTWRGVCLRVHVNDQVRMIPAHSPCLTPLILTLFGILVHNAFVVWLAKFSHISTKLKLIGTIPGFGLIKILRGREGSWLGETDEPGTVCGSHWFYVYGNRMR